ncbi:MAG: DNA polymerase III subunit gamma/tau [Candidatus Latescibacteria bacterium]|nr:DNA polymerase III subunit gamma/tau [Candidatus Latescibacterota bacterium]NIM21145.1 DNA polymerase III subunit gamma/tau [Candidatus Latescibacterota bacterium]NIM65280.1 DNA polymerase III subunit gamma/tau [Candidatus Latescibacterota bacterium]NIO01795.1 DNA polymerase III subunit gamma/tau [Candidatus Latescibacterota bacterium]NIO28312.1 DNA polymerase III subunit gamma/tau [Candidatus Latescibacterota bacterium]
MSYEVLARKWRPQTFDEVIGQDHITRTLRKAVELGRISHAYLFSGPRGCGKTSTARILAKVINCSELRDGNPCNACSSCVGVIRGKNLDVMEIDGASHTGVAEVRDLQESIGYAPSQYMNKIYIIDEVHMLSTHAFNALLKTLEEPPKHVYFVFATTAPHKIPETIKSRCQRHHFKRLEIGEIAGQLEKICQAEKVEYEQEALRLLARKAEGSMRDGESLLDQCITASTGKVTTSAVRNILGLLDAEMVFSFLEKIADKNPTDVLKQLDRSIDEGVDLLELAGALLEGFRDLMILTAPGDLRELIFRSKDEIASLNKLVAAFELPDLVTIVERLCNVTPRLKTASDPRVLLESVLVDITLLDKQVDIRDLIARLQSGDQAVAKPEGGGSGRKTRHPEKGREAEKEGGLETAPDTRGLNGIGSKGVAAYSEQGKDFMPDFGDRNSSRETMSQAAPSAPGPSIAKEADTTGTESPSDLDLESIQERWKDFVTFVRTKNASLGIFLDSTTPSVFHGGIIQLEFPKSAVVLAERVDDPKGKQALVRMLKKFFNQEMDVSYTVVGGADIARKENGDARRNAKQSSGRNAIEQQPIVKKIIEDFDGEIVTYRP